MQDHGTQLVNPFELRINMSHSPFPAACLKKMYIVELFSSMHRFPERI